MKTKDFARVLGAIADVADFERSEELHRLALFFDQSANETMLARLKRLNPSDGHPAKLKLCLVSLHGALKAGGAKKQAQIVNAVLGLFGGRAGLNIETFLAEISSPTDHRNVPAGPHVDTGIADRVIDKLSQASLDEESFNSILAALRSPRDISVPTLAHIARRLLGDKASYRDRKTAVRAIARHHRGLASATTAAKSIGAQTRSSGVRR